MNGRSGWIPALATVAIGVIGAIGVIVAGCGGGSFAAAPDASTDGASDGGSVDARAMDSSVPTDAPDDSRDATTQVDSGPCTLPPVNAAAGVFVLQGSATGDPNCGTMASPCSTVQLGVGAAAAMSKSIVYVGPGSYTEAVTVSSTLTIQGGYDSGWNPTCSNTDTVIRPGMADITVHVTGGVVTLSTIKLRSKAATPSNGESFYGLEAEGNGTQVLLDDVAILLDRAGDGITGGMGATGVPGVSGSCPPGPGTAGEAGAPGAGSDGGVFTSQGYTPGSGIPGHPGAPGADGPVLTAPGTVTCGACTGVAPACAFLKSGVGDAGTAAQPGCGGGGAGGGGGGGGGGSSIAILVWSGALVTINGNCVLLAGGGGNGGGGGPSGAVGGGGLPVPGHDSQPCTVGCVSNGSACIPEMDAGAAGTAGSGGAGGLGGGGGGGAGGSSIDVVQGAGAMVTIKGAPSLTFGNAGAGGGPAGLGGTPGVAVQRLSL
jgi:hypothetical protein